MLIDKTTTAGWLGIDAVRRARDAGRGIVRHTPTLSCRSLDEFAGAPVFVKAENLQRTGSFKLRGALSRLAGETAPDGVVAGSAGNHAQALAYAARVRGIPCELFMPADAAVAKVAAVRAFGGTVQLGGASVDDCVAAARERAEQTGAVFVHPFDDPRIIAGQGTLGLELLEDLPEVATVIVPVGGGGLIGGVAGVLKALRPSVRIIGVQAEHCAPFPAARREGGAVAVPVRPTIADGIAIKRPGRLTLPLVDAWVDDLVTVAEEDVAEAMVLLLERSKLVVEGAGAVGVAALLGGRLPRATADGPTVVVLSGGNVDAGLLAQIANHHETHAGRRLRLFTRVPDRPGGLAGLVNAVATAGGNLRTLDHVRDAVDLPVRDTGVHVVLETRGPEHSEAIVVALRDAGYEVDAHGAA